MDGGVLLLVEALLPERAAEIPPAIRMDLHMLLLLTGQERTERDCQHLLERAGFRLERVVPTSSPMDVSIMEATKVGGSPWCGKHDSGCSPVTFCRQP